MKYDSAIQIKEIVKFAGKWIELEKKIILSQVTQTQEDKYGMCSLICRCSLISH